MGRLKEIVAVTTKIVSKTDSMMRISLEHMIEIILCTTYYYCVLPEGSLQLQIVVFQHTNRSYRRPFQGEDPSSLVQ